MVLQQKSLEVVQLRGLSNQLLLVYRLQHRFLLPERKRVIILPKKYYLNCAKYDESTTFAQIFPLVIVRKNYQNKIPILT